MKQIFLDKIGLTVDVADTFWRRSKGLLGTKKLEDHSGLLLTPCNSVHMIGMRYAIDVVYLDKEGVIIKIVEGLKPNIGISCCIQAKSALEIASGMARQYALRLGQSLFE